MMLETWRKSSLSFCNSNCVEVAGLGTLDGAHPSEMIHVRDSKDQSSPCLVFTPAQWRSFISAVKAGEHG